MPKYRVFPGVAKILMIDFSQKAPNSSDFQCACEWPNLAKISADKVELGC